MTGVVTWKKPEPKAQEGPTVEIIGAEKKPKDEMPGPGQYEVIQQKQHKQQSSMFLSKVPRTNTSMTNRDTASRKLKSRGIVTSGSYRINLKDNKRPPTSATGQDLDIFDDEDEDGPPGPGQYYNP